MSIVKKLPAVLMAAVGICFSVAGTALAETVLFDKIVTYPDNVLLVNLIHRGEAKICFRTTDNKISSITISNLDRSSEIHMMVVSDQQCIPKSIQNYAAMIYVSVTDPDDDHPTASKSVHLRVTQR